jgi:hypothetical protein
MGSGAQARKAKADKAKRTQIFPQMRGIVRALVHETPIA